MLLSLYHTYLNTLYAISEFVKSLWIDITICQAIQI